MEHSVSKPVKFRIGSIHGCTNYYRDEQAFHRTDVPIASRLSKEAVKASVLAPSLANGQSYSINYDVYDRQLATLKQGGAVPEQSLLETLHSPSDSLIVRNWQFEDHNTPQGFKRAAWDQRTQLLATAQEKHLDKVYEAGLRQTARLESPSGSSNSSEVWNASTIVSKQTVNTPNVALAGKQTQQDLPFYTSLQQQFLDNLEKQREDKRRQALEAEKLRLDQEIQQLVLKGEYEEVLRKARQVTGTITFRDTSSETIANNLSRTYNADTLEAYIKQQELAARTGTEAAVTHRPLSYITSGTLMETQLSSTRLTTLGLPALKKTLPENNKQPCYKRTENLSHKYIKPKPVSTYKRTEVPLYMQVNIPDDCIDDDD